MILELTPNTHPILHNKVKPCSVNLDRHFVAKTLVENMHHYEGIGLAANQIGMDVRAFAMIRDLENNEIIVCFNPKIVKKYMNYVNVLSKSLYMKVFKYSGLPFSFYKFYKFTYIKFYYNSISI